MNHIIINTINTQLGTTILILLQIQTHISTLRIIIGKTQPPHITTTHTNN